MLVARCCWAAIMKTKPVEGLEVDQVQFRFSTCVGLLCIILMTDRDVQHMESNEELHLVHSVEPHYRNEL